MKKIIYVIAALLAVVIIYSVITYYGLVSANKEVHSKWEQVKRVYFTKAELITNLVNSVEGYVDNETKVLTGIANLSVGYKNAKSIEDFVRFDANLIILIELIVHIYPDLKANENFIRIQEDIESTDERIEIAIKEYIKSVTKYNKKIKTFPTSIFANIFKFEKIHGHTVQ